MPVEDLPAGPPPPPLEQTRVEQHALGVEGSARMTAQGLCAVVAGALTDVVGAWIAITGLALASLTMTAALAPSLRRAAQAADARRQATGSNQAT